MAPSPNDTSLILTSSREGNGTNPVALFRMPGEGSGDAVTNDESRNYDNDAIPLEEVAQLGFQDQSTFVNSFAWHSTRDTVLSLDPASLTMWNIREGGMEVSTVPYYYCYG